jgi:flagellar biosynthesis protein FlhF
MDIRTYRAGSMQEALRLVRQELGPEAAVLQTREVGGGVFRWLRGGRRIEVTAALDVHVPSRLPPDNSPIDDPPEELAGIVPARPARTSSAYEIADSGNAEREELQFLSGATEEPMQLKTPWTNWSGDSGIERRGGVSGGEGLRDGVAGARRLSSDRGTAGREVPSSLFALFTELIDAELSEDLARDLISELRERAAEAGADPTDTNHMRQLLRRMVQQQIPVSGPIRVTPGRRRIVALVGPTGVGKTTTIAKLAANFHLRDRHRVGLITVDTYRIAAVEQLRTYADIIDLPMEVVSTPREMRQAVQRLADLDLLLLDTAGRSPRDEVRIQELKSLLAEAQADEVHLVMSSVASLPSLTKTAERFARVGISALLMTKLDEATGLGSLLPLLSECRLPLSYLTHGQNVPDDITAAEPARLAQCILHGPETLNENSRWPTSAWRRQNQP